jgi:hypothetical protein
MPAYINPVARRSVLKALAAAPALATPLTASSPDRDEPTGRPRKRPSRPPFTAPPLAHETLIGVL